MGWRHVALEDIAKIVGGSTPRRDNAAFWNGDIPWLTPTDLPPLGSGVTNIADTASHITKEGFRSSSLTLLPPATVVFSSRATIGKVGVTDVPITTNQGFVNLIPSDGVDPRYLAWALFHHADQIAALSGSTTFKEVSRTSVKKFRIPLPPLEEQRRIAHLLDEADRLQRLRKEANEKAQRILPALFVEMFGDPETNPMGWEVRALGDTCEMRSGGTPSRKNHAYYGGANPWVKIGDLDTPNGVIVATEERITETGLGAIRGRLFPEGTVLLAMYASVGKTAIAGVPLTMNQAILGMSPSADVLNPMYLWQFLRASQRALVGKVNEGTQKNISATIVRAHPIPLPPIALQRAFAAACSGVVGLHGLQADATARQSSAAEVLRSRLFAEAV